LLQLNNYLYDFTSHYEGILTVTQDGPNLLTGVVGADAFVFNSKVGADMVTDFKSGVDKLFVSQEGIGVGDGDTVVENSITITGPGGFSTNAELVMVQKNIVGAITVSNAAAAIGSANAAYAIGATALFAVDNGKDTNVFLFSSSANDSTITADELSLVVVVSGVAATTVGNYGFVT